MTRKKTLHLCCLLGRECGWMLEKKKRKKKSKGLLHGGLGAHVELHVGEVTYQGQPVGQN